MGLEIQSDPACKERDACEVEVVGNEDVALARHEICDCCFGIYSVVIADDGILRDAVLARDQTHHVCFVSAFWCCASAGEDDAVICVTLLVEFDAGHCAVIERMTRRVVVYDCRAKNNDTVCRCFNVIVIVRQDNDATGTNDCTEQDYYSHADFLEAGIF